jgi:hypothetical protein
MAIAGELHKAVAAGLRCRPMTETIRDSLAWWQTLTAARRENNQFAWTPQAEADAFKAAREMSLF